MINVSLHIDDSICNNCPYFLPEMDHLFNNEKIYVTCEHYTLCGYLKDHINNEEKKNGNK